MWIYVVDVVFLCPKLCVYNLYAIPRVQRILDFHYGCHQVTLSTSVIENCVGCTKINMDYIVDAHYDPTHYLIFKIRVLWCYF